MLFLTHKHRDIKRSDHYTQDTCQKHSKGEYIKGLFSIIKDGGLSEISICVKKSFK